MFIFSLAFTRTGTLGILGSTESSFIQVWSHFSCPEKPDQSLLRIVQRNKEAFQGPSLYIRICSKRDFFFLRKSITNLGGQATQSASWISLYFVSTLHMTMKGCDILTGSRLHQAVHNELENNKIQMLSQVNTSLLSKVNQIRRILLQVFFLLALLFYVKVSSSLLALQCSSNTVKPLVLFSCISGTESQILKKTSHLHEWL